MEPLSEAQIRASLVNCSKGEASRIKLPAGFAGLPWADLDFLGWSDPGAPLRAVIVVPGPVGIVLRRPEPKRTTVMRSSMCRVCLTQHSADGVTLFVAPLAGAAGQRQLGRRIPVLRPGVSALPARQTATPGPPGTPGGVAHRGRARRPRDDEPERLREAGCALIRAGDGGEILG